jgi:hypothetical protein
MRCKRRRPSVGNVAPHLRRHEKPAQTVATLNVLNAARQAGVEIPKAAERQVLAQ